MKAVLSAIRLALVAIRRNKVRAALTVLLGHIRGVDQAATLEDLRY